MFLYNCLMLFRIHRMKEAARESFRWAAHTGGLAVVKPKDYELAGEIEGANVYDAWSILRRSDAAFQTGDILEDQTGEGEAGQLWVAKYIGFEKAQWWVAEVKTTGTPQPEPAPGGIDRIGSGPAEASATL